jgi:site-specific DNA recombinase
LRVFTGHQTRQADPTADVSGERGQGQVLLGGRHDHILPFSHSPILPFDQCLDEEILAARLESLRTKQKQLRHRQAELTEEIDDEPVMPARSTLRTVVKHIETIIETGDDLQRKALVEALVAEVKIVGPDRLVPIFKIPRPDTPRDAANGETGHTDRPKPTRPATTHAPHRGAAAVLPATTPPKGAVRAMPTLVELRGFEPLTPSMRTRCATGLRYSPEERRTG